MMIISIKVEHWTEHLSKCVIEPSGREHAHRLQTNRYGRIFIVFSSVARWAPTVLALFVHWTLNHNLLSYDVRGNL